MTNLSSLTPLIVQHPLYLVLSHSTDKRQAAYRDLYERHFDEKTLEEVSASINKAWVLGSVHFKDKIATQFNRLASPLPKGGNRKSGKREKP